MAVRTFVDARGTRWQVWAVRPTTRELRSGQDRRASAAHDARFAARPRGPERRVRDLGRPAGVAASLTGGWLCFEAEARAGTAMRRRLAPIPAQWETAPESALRAHLDRAAPAVPASRTA